MKIKTIKAIDLGDWDELVQKTYGRPYSLQQQDGCMSRGNVSLTVPGDGDDYENDTVPEVVNGEEMGVSFKAWLERDPKKLLPTPKDEEKFPALAVSSLRMWWERNFYPALEVVAFDLHSKGLLEAGEYTIVIDW